MDVVGKDGRYELQTLLGEGPRSKVYRAVDLRSRTAVIVKTFEAPLLGLIKYADAVARMSVANVAAVVLPIDLDITPGASAFAAFTPIDGDSLEASRRSGAIAWSRAVEIVADCATALAAIKAATGLHHLALKPSNVWIGRDGTTYILDLGTALLGPATQVRRSTEFFFDYRAPEQLDGSPGDARTDVFTLAVLLVELMTGVHPFSGTTAGQAAQKLKQTPPDLSELTRGMAFASAREVSRLMTQALSADPDQRPKDVTTFATDLGYVRRSVGAPAPLAFKSPPGQLSAPAVQPVKKESIHDGLGTLPTMRPRNPAPVARATQSPIVDTPAYPPAEATQHIPAYRPTAAAAAPPLAEATQHLPAYNPTPATKAARQPAAEATQHLPAYNPPSAARHDPVEATQHLPAYNPPSAARHDPVEATQHLPAYNPPSAARHDPVEATQHLPAYNPPSTIRHDPVEATQHLPAYNPPSTIRHDPVEATQHLPAYNPPSAARHDPVEATQHLPAYNPPSTIRHDPVEATQHLPAYNPVRTPVPADRNTDEDSSEHDDVATVAAPRQDSSIPRAPVPSNSNIDDDSPEYDDVSTVASPQYYTRPPPPHTPDAFEPTAPLERSIEPPQPIHAPAQPAKGPLSPSAQWILIAINALLVLILLLDRLT